MTSLMPAPEVLEARAAPGALEALEAAGERHLRLASQWQLRQRQHLQLASTLLVGSLAACLAGAFELEVSEIYSSPHAVSLITIKTSNSAQFVRFLKKVISMYFRLLRY